ncbi:MAG: sugar transferase [Gemmatimonadetes bacterium]|nr:sugar transferase [Gemmatimonadota bacterium]
MTHNRNVWSFPQHPPCSGGQLVDLNFDECEVDAFPALSAARRNGDLVPCALTREQRLAKRIVDVVASSVALVVASPLLLVLAALVKIDSPGPVFFSDARLGLGGRRFHMFKFRTMRAGADEEKASVAHLNASEDSRLFKIRGDPRVTRVGRVIRRWSLDELPQLVNVLVGDMSLVGPRPFFEEDLTRYEPHHLERLSVLPGVTGVWQVSGRSDILDFEEVVRLDRGYIDAWSLRGDLRILMMTIPAVVQRRGAY